MSGVTFLVSAGRITRTVARTVHIVTIGEFRKEVNQAENMHLSKRPSSLYLPSRPVSSDGRKDDRTYTSNEKSDEYYTPSASTNNTVRIMLDIYRCVSLLFHTNKHN